MHESKCYKLLLVDERSRYIKEPNLILSVMLEIVGGEEICDKTETVTDLRTRFPEGQMIELGLLA